jgi:hypothetical protein
MKTKGKIRRSYIKPKVTQVKLEIQEAVLANCKTQTGASGKNQQNTCSLSGPSCSTAWGS